MHMVGVEGGVAHGYAPFPLLLANPRISILGRDRDAKAVERVGEGDLA